MKIEWKTGFARMGALGASFSLLAPCQGVSIIGSGDASAPGPDPDAASLDGSPLEPETSSESGSCKPALTRCGDACVDTQSDAKNCGGCGTLCTGDCTLGRCRVEIAPVRTETAYGLAVDGTALYWADVKGHLNCGDGPSLGTVMKWPLGGGPPAPLYVAPAADCTEQQRNLPQAIAVYGPNVYWTTVLGGIGTIPKSGGAATMLDSNTKGNQSFGIAVNGDGVYTSFGRWMRRVPLSGGVATVLCKDCGGPGVVADASDVYWIGGVGVGKVAAVGGKPSELSSLGGSSVDGVQAIAVDATSIYWTGTSGGGGLFRIPLSGGEATTLVAPGYGGENGAVAVDASNVYWVNESGAYRVPLSGGEPVWLAPSATGGRVFVAAVGAESLYWIESAGTGGGAVVQLTPK